MQIFFQTYNPNFQTRHIRYSQESVTKLMTPLLEGKLLYNEVKKESGLSDSMINRWFRETKGITSCRYFRALERELNAGYNTDDELKKMKKPQKVVRKKALSLREVLNERLYDNVPMLLEEGYNVKSISKILKCDSRTVTKWIHNNLCDNIRTYKHQNRIIPKKDIQV